MIRLNTLLIFCLLAGLTGSPAWAQGIQFEGHGVTEVEAPRDASGAARMERLKDSGVQAKITYASKIDGDVKTAEPPDRAFDGSDGFSTTLSGSVGILLVIGVLGACLFLWMFFGGSALLARDTSDKVKVSPAVPEGWSESVADLSGTGALSQIAALADRRAALVRLLRLCLLHAGQATSTGFRRADTERIAFRRLPSGWGGLDYLKRLLFAAELAHYGGRPVSEADFASLIDGARAILPRQEGGHA